MANRPVFIALPAAPYVRRKDIEFKWFAGMSTAQKRKSIASQHEAFTARFPGKKVLEISSASEIPLGVHLSAFNLSFDYDDEHRCTVECAYQSSKVFEKSGQPIDLLFKTSREAKTDPRVSPEGDRFVCYRFRDQIYPAAPRTAFYDWLYCNALLEMPEEDMAELLEYDAFTDIAFNPQKSVNCQARAAALMISLIRQRGLTDELREDISSFDAFLAIERESTQDMPAAVPSRPAAAPARPAAPAAVPEQAPEEPPIEAGPGTAVEHKAFGPGIVTAQDGGYVTVRFGEEEKKFGFPYSFVKGFLKIRE